CSYKVITKVLANRLKVVIPKIISNSQSTFIEGRQILDGVLIASEVLNHIKKKMLLFKVGFEKAFDSISWNFLDNILNQMNFGDKWRLWIRGCLKSACVSVLVNRSPTQKFNMEKGLSQGGPVSPFLFIIVVEALYVAILEASNSGLYKGIELGLINENIFLLQYANVLLFFRDCKLYGVGVGSLEVDRMARIMSCSYGCMHFVYLGLPIGKSMRNASAWHHIVDQFYSWLSHWKAKVDRWVMGRNEWEGDWCWTRDLRGRAHDDLSALIVTLSELALSSDRLDSWRYRIFTKGQKQS
ncbi:putative RNA-directed DNA polymerase, eukaryota, reverse transcriptase zinc-binding domain protein, partial [Tanacetum coccineum]